MRHQAREHHVAVYGDDANDGSASRPLRTVQAAAARATPGDTVTIHEGVYRERVDPPRGGLSDGERITYRAAEGETVAIKGSEVVRGWVRQDRGVWMVTLENAWFGAFNPYSNLIGGDWFFPQGRKHHTGAVYLNDRAFAEAAALEDVFDETGVGAWFGKSGVLATRVWANFGDADPNEELVEINVRQSVFYPSRPGIDYLTVRGLLLSQAATPWSPPTTEQIGLIGVNWSKGWVIEANTITHARCAGLTLGKGFDREDGRLEYGFNAHDQTVRRVLGRGDWTRERVGGHVVRNNRIACCEQAGVVGSHGGAFCRITGNVIHDIHTRRLFDGFEQAGIKLHGAVDTEIAQNLIFNCNMGVWLDWMNQGSRVSGNLMHGNRDWDLFVEISHGPCLVDNNCLLSAVSVHDSAQGTAYVHNLFAGEVRLREEPLRATPYFRPHSTDAVGSAKVGDGDDRYVNNLVCEARGLSAFDACREALTMEGNLYLHRARPSRFEEEPHVEPGADNRFVLTENGGAIELEMAFVAAWRDGKARRVVDTARLGEASTPGQKFENPDGTPLAIDRDYLGAARPAEHPFPGPFEISASTGAVRVWPPSGSVGAAIGRRGEQGELEVEPR